MNFICVFCGSRMGNHPVYRQKAEELGREIVRRECGLVYGGGNVGLMGIIADSVMANGGQVIGVIPQFMVPKELAHEGITELRLVDTMHERKQMMADIASAFISMPGGIGTFEECLEQMAWLKLQLHEKPSGLLNVAGYYQSLIRFLQDSVDRGFFDQMDLDDLIVAEEPTALLDRLLPTI